jgi:hypothetical protein
MFTRHSADWALKQINCNIHATMDVMHAIAPHQTEYACFVIVSGEGRPCGWENVCREWVRANERLWRHPGTRNEKGIAGKPAIP